jgi:uncharacterized protein (TIGR00661 family)
MQKLKIAYSICGEGHGHYGRNVGIIKELIRRLPNCQVDLYLYGDTQNIFLKDKEFCKLVNIYKIRGFRFIYKNTGIIKSLTTTLFNKNNNLVFFQIIRLNFLYLFFLIFKKIFRLKEKNYFNSYLSKPFKKFDFAITDLEPLLPRIALLREKPFLTLDNQHAMLYGDLNIKKLRFTERLEYLFIINFLKTYHPKSDLSILTTFCEVPIKAKYVNRVKAVGPLLRKNIIKVKENIKYKDYILIYAHKVLGTKLFPILAKIKDCRFVVFTTDDFNSTNFQYRRDWIEYHSIDPIKFISKLAECKAVISSAGNTLLSEAIYLKKSFYGITLQGLFEQRLNLYLLHNTGWGDGCKISELSEKHISGFINDIDKYNAKIQNAKTFDNTDKIVDLIIDKIHRDVFQKQLTTN